MTLWGRTPEAAWAGPYAPWIEALSSLDGGAEELFSTPDSLSPEDRQAQIHERVLARLGVTVARKPALLVLDDLHWALPSTLDLLRHVAFNFDRSPLLVVGTYRTSAAAPHLPLGKMLGHLRREANVLDIQLTGLDRTQLGILLESAWTERLDRILEETNGNPLFAIEIGRALEHARPKPAPMESGDPSSRPEVPLTVRQAIGQRLDALSDSVQHILSIGSLFAEGFERVHDLHPDRSSRE